MLLYRTKDNVQHWSASTPNFVREQKSLVGVRCCRKQAKLQQDIETMIEKDKHIKQMNQTKIIEYLMDKNVNVNARDIYGFTPLHYAALTNNLVAARFLLEKKEIKVNKICEKKNYFGNLFQKYLCNAATLFF